MNGQNANTEGDLNPALRVAKRTIPLQTRPIVMVAA